LKISLPPTFAKKSGDSSSSPFLQAIARNSGITGDMLKIHLFPISPSAKAAIVGWEFLRPDLKTMSWVHKPLSWTSVYHIDR